MLPEGCNSSSDPQGCDERRGRLFDLQESSTWVQKAIFQLPIPAEQPWGYTGNGSLGFDLLKFPRSDGGSFKLLNATISAYATKDLFLGLLGLSPFHLVTDDASGSWMSSLLISMKESGQIGSLSWGYTAGSKHDQALGSLTLGGYDAARLTATQLTISLREDPFRDLVVGLQGVTSGTQNLLMDSISVFIGSRLP